MKLRDRSTLRKPSRYQDAENGNTASLGQVEDISIPEALKDQNWREAITKEFDFLIKMDTWKLVKLPKGRKALTCRWVLVEKEDGKFKARVVARGYEQQKGVYYSGTFSPVARHDSIRFLLSVAASEGMYLMTFDVTTDFLHGNLEEDIYMH